MIFTHSKWDAFCERLKENDIISRPACNVEARLDKYLVLKHDVETDVPRALEIAKIEHKYGHKGSYYVQAYLLEDPENVKRLQQMQQMGHEISYHYDVMDSCKGDLDAAILEFEKNRANFEMVGFPLKTICQHGNPVMERNGYHSNRDFFRNNRVQKLYPNLADIMVDYPEKYETDYLYFSDAGRKFQRIYDPINNDIVNSDDKNVLYEDFDELFAALSERQGNIISIHPHRWMKSAFLYAVKAAVFNVVRTAAKILMKVPLFKRLMSKYYHLAKKF